MTNSAIVVAPLVDIDERLSSDNVFKDLYGGLSSKEWLDFLVKSIDNKKIDGINFPTFPPIEFQSQLHGHFGSHSLAEAETFYSFAVNHGLLSKEIIDYQNSALLDFGSGWGRVLRLFMRDFPLKNIIGYEPDPRYCIVARANNPYVGFLSGGFLPDGILPSNKFSLIVGWSVFSHLSLFSATEWLKEFSRILVSNGKILVTTWGLRFLERLKSESEALKRGEDIHWYSKVCLEAVG